MVTLGLNPWKLQEHNKCSLHPSGYVHLSSQEFFHSNIKGINSGKIRKIQTGKKRQRVERIMIEKQTEGINK